MYVNYTVHGKEFQAGPYASNEVEEHKRDIAGYEGVCQCYIVSERDERRQLIG